MAINVFLNLCVFLSVDNNIGTEGVFDIIHSMDNNETHNIKDLIYFMVFRGEMIRT